MQLCTKHACMKTYMMWWISLIEYIKEGLWTTWSNSHKEHDFIMICVENFKMAYMLDL